jgi:hypothetical protein
LTKNRTCSATPLILRRVRDHQLRRGPDPHLRTSMKRIWPLSLSCSQDRRRRAVQQFRMAPVSSNLARNYSRFKSKNSLRAVLAKIMSLSPDQARTSSEVTELVAVHSLKMTKNTPPFAVGPTHRPYIATGKLKPMRAPA